MMAEMITRHLDEYFLKYLDYLEILRRRETEEKQSEYRRLRDKS